ncbi:MAG: hypothetical protein AAF517_26705 [Planctomycetota bacterium]
MKSSEPIHTVSTVRQPSDAAMGIRMGNPLSNRLWNRAPVKVPGTFES